MSLKDLMQNGINVKHVKIRIIEKHDENIIVGDKTMIAICMAVNAEFKKVIEGKCYMLLKPVKHDANYFIPNEKLKPVKISDFSISVKTKDVQKLADIIQTNPSLKTTTQADIKINLSTFEDIETLPPNSEIKTISVKVISISKDIAGKYGDYNIGKIKDKSGEKMDINLYNKQIKKNFKRGDIIELRKLKLTEFTKEGQKSKRLSTTARSSAHNCNIEIETLFKNVLLVDERQEGTVVAIHDIFPYMSCSKCWRKINEDEDICECGSKEDIKVIDFHCQFYILVKQDDDDDVKIVHTFRRQTDLNPNSKEIDDIQKLLDDTFVDQSYIFEWNVDLDKEELRMVDITANNQKVNLATK